MGTELLNAEKEDNNGLAESRLERECANLDPESEQEFADEGLIVDIVEWPKF